MKKSILIGLAAVLFAGGGAAIAVSGQQDFEDMLPYMQERHPDMTEEELENHFEEYGMRGPHWNEEEGYDMHRGPNWHEDGYGMHRGPHWNEDGKGYGMMDRGGCQGQDRGWGPGSDTDRDFPEDRGPGMGRQHEEGNK